MKNNNNIYIILSIFAAASLFLVVFFIWPLSNEIKKNSEDLISAKNNIVTLDAETNEIHNFAKNYESYKLNFEKIDRLFVDLNNPVDFIKFLESTAASSQITSQISLPPSSNQSFIIFQFSSTGRFPDVLLFSKRIEAGPYLIEIENLTIQNSPGQGDKGIVKDYFDRKVDATFMIKVFIKK